jgi:hypothetical protein
VGDNAILTLVVEQLRIDGCRPVNSGMEKRLIG